MRAKGPRPFFSLFRPGGAKEIPGATKGHLGPAPTPRFSCTSYSAPSIGSSGSNPKSLSACIRISAASSGPRRACSTTSAATIRRPVGAGPSIHDRFHGFRVGRLCRLVASPVATIRRPVGAGPSIHDRFHGLRVGRLHNVFLPGAGTGGKTCPCRAMMATSDPVRRFRMPVPDCRFPPLLRLAAPNNTRPASWAAKCCSASPFAVPVPDACSRRWALAVTSRGLRPSVPPSLLPSPSPACEMFHSVNVSRISEM